jgi:hypothetical protein
LKTNLLSSVKLAGDGRPRGKKVTLDHFHSFPEKVQAFIAQLPSIEA